MKKFDKAIILFIGVLALFGAFRTWYFEKAGEEITVGGHQVSLLPCKSGINELFGSGIDSIGMCECLLPKFYELIKDDSDKINHFKEVGFFTLEGKSNDSAILLLRNCALNNLLDTNYKIKLSPYIKASIINKYKDQFESKINPNTIEYESFIKCVFENMDGRITIKEYLADDYTENDKIITIINNCFQMQSKFSK